MHISMLNKYNNLDTDADTDADTERSKQAFISIMLLISYVYLPWNAIEGLTLTSRHFYIVFILQSHNKMMIVNISCGLFFTGVRCISLLVATVLLLDFFRNTSHLITILMVKSMNSITVKKVIGTLRCFYIQALLCNKSCNLSLLVSSS